MARAGKTAPAPPDVTHDSVGGETVGGVEVAPTTETRTAQAIADEYAGEAMRTIVWIMRNGGRGDMARLMAAREVVAAASSRAVDGAADSGDLDLSPADVELMKRFLAEREAKGQ